MCNAQLDNLLHNAYVQKQVGVVSSLTLHKLQSRSRLWSCEVLKIEQVLQTIGTARESCIGAISLLVKVYLIYSSACNITSIPGYWSLQVLLANGNVTLRVNLHILLATGNVTLQVILATGNVATKC